MKLRDSLKLILHEYRYEKIEWIVSIILQWLIFTSVFFLLTVSFDLDSVFGGYLKTLYPDGYDFMIEGYSQSDIPALEEKGFYDITIPEDSDSGYAVTNNLDGIWFQKIEATLSGKDIWNADLDETLSVMLFGQVILGAIGFVMLITMMNNLSNSFTMKLMRRKRYINMLQQLGMSKTVCKSIYYGFFSIRNVVALVASIFTNVVLIKLLNNYMYESMYITSTFKYFNWILVISVWVISMLLMWLSFTKQWRRLNEI